MGIAGMILGIIAMVSSCIPLVGGLIAVPCAAVGIPLSFMGIRQTGKGEYQGMATAGVVTSTAALAIVIIWLAIFAKGMVPLPSFNPFESTETINSMNQGLEWTDDEQEESRENWQAHKYQDPISREIDLQMWRGSEKDTDPGYLAITTNCRMEVKKLQVDVGVMAFMWEGEDGTSAVMVRFGEGQTRMEPWTWRETDHLPAHITETVLEPPKSKMVEYLNRVAAGESLAVGYAESDGVTTRTPAFDTRGLSRAVAQAVQTHCTEA